MDFNENRTSDLAAARIGPQQTRLSHILRAEMYAIYCSSTCVEASEIRGCA
jgi:hypothetical protein